MYAFEILDRFELLFPTNSKLSDLRRVYNDQDLSSLFRLTDVSEDLRKAIIEENLHSIFRLLPEEYEDLRKAVNEENLHSIFRILEDIDYYRKLDDTRKAVTEKNLHSIFRLVGDNYDDLRKAVTEKNLHSIFRLVNDEDLRKLVIEDNTWKLWPILERYTTTQFVAAFKNFFVNDIDIDKDCFSRGQLQSKLWLVSELQDLDIDLGTVFLCAGWYGTLATMLFESGIKINKIRSFDIDPSTPDIAKVFNKPWVMEDWKFQASVEDIHNIDYNSHTYTVSRSDGTTCSLTDTPNTVINTSCEHIENFSEWYDKIPMDTLVVLQSNNYYEIEEHVNCVKDIKEFGRMAPMTGPLFAGELELPKYKRFMLIGRK